MEIYIDKRHTCIHICMYMYVGPNLMDKDLTENNKVNKNTYN